MAEHFAGQGHDVQVITGIPHYPQWSRMEMSTEGGRNPYVQRFWHYIPRRPGAVGRMLYEVSWLFSASRGALRAHADVVIGIVPSLSGAFLGLMTARRNGAPLGLIVQDLMGQAAAQSGYRGGNLVAGITGALESFVLRRCDRIGVVSEAF